MCGIDLSLWPSAKRHLEKIHIFSSLCERKKERKKEIKGLNRGKYNASFTHIRTHR